MNHNDEATVEEIALTSIAISLKEIALTLDAILKLLTPQDK